MDDKLYTMAECISDYFKKYNMSKTEPDRGDYNRISDFFNQIGLLDEWKELRRELGEKENISFKDQIWNEASKELFLLILEERNDRLNRRNGIFGKDKYSTKFVFEEVADRVLTLFDQSSDESLKLQVRKKMESFLSKQVEKTLVPLTDEKNSIDELVKKTVITNDSYLRAIERYYWINGISNDIYGVIEKWQELYEEMEEYRRQEVIDVVTRDGMRYKPMLDKVIESASSEKIASDKEIQSYIKEMFQIVEVLNGGKNTMSGEEYDNKLKEYEKLSQKKNSRIAAIKEKCKDEVELWDISRHLKPAKTLVEEMDIDYQTDKIRELLVDKEIRKNIQREITRLDRQDELAEEGFPDEMKLNNQSL